MNSSRLRANEWSTTSLGESCSRCGKCLAKMQLVLLAVLLYSTLATGTALQLLALEVPSIADPRWDKVTLRCEYNLGGMDLYSVKWYKDGAEFFRFTPGSRPAGRDFSVEGVYVDVDRSDSKQVTLLGQANNRRGKVNLAGSYGCEVSTEGPSFLTTYGEANMSVAIPAKEPPSIHGLRASYEAGETLQAECISAPSYPPAHLLFILNGKEVNGAFTKDLSSGGAAEGKMESSNRLGLSMRLERHHFPGGTLNLVCQSTLPGIPSAGALKTTQTLTLAASNQRLAQEPPRSASNFNVPFLATFLGCILVTARSICPDNFPLLSV